MVELLKNIEEHKDNNNIRICYNLCTLIINNNIQKEEDLKRIEDSFFNTNDINKRNEIKYNAYLSDITHIEKFDQNVIAELNDYEKAYESTEDELIKTKCLIFIYDLIEWDFIFPYTAYKLMLADQLN